MADIDMREGVDAGNAAPGTFWRYGASVTVHTVHGYAGLTGLALARPSTGAP